LGLLPWSSRLRLLKFQLNVLRHTNKLDMDNIVASHPFDTQSVKDFSAEQLDLEALNYLIAPIVRGLFYWDMASTSKAFLYILFKYALTMRVFNFRRGIRVLPDTIAKHIDIHLQTEVLNVDYCQLSKLWQTTVRNKEGIYAIESKAVISTVPATCINPILPNLPTPIKNFFDQVNYSSNTITHMILKERIEVPYYALFYPPHLNEKIAVVNLQSRKHHHKQPLKRDTISVFPSSEFSQEIMPLSDSAVQETILATLRATYPFQEMNFVHCIDRSVVTRVEQALPILDVNYIRRLKDFETNLSRRLPTGLFFAGDFLGGPSIEGAVVSSEKILDDVTSLVG
jgi:oxygen-dependent protoporphyrinogen oxidase